MRAEYTRLARLARFVRLRADETIRVTCMDEFLAIIAAVSHEMSAPARPPDPPPEPLISDEPTIELVVRAQGGDRQAAEALLQRSVPQLKRWAHGKLPAAARGALDTGDLVQETVLHVLRRLDTFQPRHVGAMQAYLRQSVLNRIRDEVRRIGRHPTPCELPADMPSDTPSPLERAVEAEAVGRYQQALGTLSVRDRQLVVARIEAQWSHDEIARHFGMPTADAARMAVSRALRRLLDFLKD
jgi:RNA polymerase sigma-70 factor (ECF subfamily)